MKAPRVVIQAITLLAALLATSTVSFATKEYNKKEKKPCTACHTKGKATKDNPLLNDVGKYYHEKKTLQGAPEPAPAPKK
jgi:mono/diheme cytochrome c family protein